MAVEDGSVPQQLKEPRALAPSNNKVATSLLAPQSSYHKLAQSLQLSFAHCNSLVLFWRT